MQIETKLESKSPILKEITITVKPETIRDYIEKQFTDLQKKAALKGFRKGKVPMTILKQQFMGDVKSDVFSKVIQDSYSKALDEHNINPVGYPKIEPKSGMNMDDGENLTFVAKVEIYPEIKVSEISKLKVSKPSTEIKKDEIEKTVEQLRKSYADVEPTDYAGPAKDGDMLELSFEGTINGKSHEALIGKNRMLKMGAGQYMDGFENGILGMKKGESKTIEVEFPKDFQDKEFAGNKAVFQVTVHEFKKETLPELNDEFAKKFRAENMADLRKKIEDDIKTSQERKSRNTLKERLIDAMIEANTFDVPSHFVSMQFEHLLKENAQTLAQQGFTEKMVKDFLDKNKKEIEARALKQVQASLLLDKVAIDQNIKIDDADLEKEYSRISEEQKVELAEVQKFFENADQRRELKFRLKEEKTFEYIMSQAKISIEK